MTDPIKKIITITDLQPIKDFGLNVISEETRYAMFFKKKDESETKAYSQFKSKQLGLGDSVEIAYTEEEKEYEKDGEKKTGINRRIMWFGDVVTNTPEQEEITLDNIPF